MSFQKIEDLDLVNRRRVKKQEKNLKRVGLVSSDEVISGVFEEAGLEDGLVQILEGLSSEVGGDVTIEMHSRAAYDVLKKMVAGIGLTTGCGLESEAIVQTKYKTVAKKVKPVATQLPPDTMKHIKQAVKEPGLREKLKIGHQFTEESLAKLKIGGG